MDAIKFLLRSENLEIPCEISVTKWKIVGYLFQFLQNPSSDTIFLHKCVYSIIRSLERILLMYFNTPKNTFVSAIVVLFLVFIISYTLFRRPEVWYSSKLQKYWTEDFPRNGNFFLSSFGLDLKNKSLSQSLSLIYKTHKVQRFDLNNLYTNIIAKYMSPWLIAASNIHDKHITIGESSPVFSSAHMLELKLLCRHYIIHFRITRYIKQMEESGSIKWILRPGKPNLQWIPIPCSGLASHGIIPEILRDNNSKPSLHLGYWDILQHLIRISRNSDLPDHVDLFIWDDDFPLLEPDREYHFSSLRSLVGTMRKVSIPFPVLTYCNKANKFGIPFLFDNQLILKPVEKLVHSLLTFRNRSSDELAQTLHEFNRRNDTAVWRGSATGQMNDFNNWLLSQRSKLVQLSMMAPHLLDARITHCHQCLPGVEQLMKSSFGKWFGVSFANSDTYFRTKFLVDVDGNTWSSRFYELMLTGATVFKVNSTDRCDEFWYDLLRPGIDFVPVAHDMHDLFSKLIYFRAHPNEALRIANSGLKRVSFLLRADIWPRYATGILRAIAALQTKPDSPEEQTIASLGLTSEVCSTVSSAWCICKPA